MKIYLILALFLLIPQGVYAVKWSEEEKSYIENNRYDIIVALEENYAPFIYVKPGGQPEGLSIDYLRYLEKIIGINFIYDKPSSLESILEKAKRGEIYIVSSVTETEERKTYLNFTEPYISTEALIYINNNNDIKSINDLVGKNVAVGKDYGVQKFIENKYPEWKLDLVPDDITALQKLSGGMVDAAVVDIASANFITSNYGFYNIKYFAPVGFSYKLSFAVPKQHEKLFGILNKAMRDVTNTEAREINKKWQTLDLKNSKTNWFAQDWIRTGAIGVSILLLFLLLRQTYKSK